MRKVQLRNCILVGIMCVSALLLSGCDDMATDPGNTKPTFTPAPLVSQLPTEEKVENTSIKTKSSAETPNEFFYPVPNVD